MRKSLFGLLAVIAAGLAHGDLFDEAGFFTVTASPETSFTEKGLGE